jgi:hypothetical protein
VMAFHPSSELGGALEESGGEGGHSKGFGRRSNDVNVLIPVDLCHPAK